MTVYVVQKQMRWDAARQDLVPRFDLGPAERYGALDFLLSPTAAPFHAESIVRELHEKLRHYEDDDYLLLVGNPCIIGWATAIAASHNNGRVRMLQWSGKDQDYIEVSADLSDRD